jgi:hypothetical protein
LSNRHKHGRLTSEELIQIRNDLGKRRLLGLESDNDFNDALRDAGFADFQNTGREGLAGPSEMGAIPAGQFFAIIPMGGGYYYVPPIQNNSVKDIGQQFFD